jgi:hypothetical protein
MAKRLNVNKENNDEWLTPPEIVHACGEFDLDPCSPINRPWPTAKQHFTVLDDGLLRDWFGRVWMNPPYGRVLSLWMNRMAMHGDGVALVYNRSETVAFQSFVFPFADSILYIKGRIDFYRVDGTQAKTSGGAPSVLIAYGAKNSDAIAESNIAGHHQLINRRNFIIIGVDRSWKLVVKAVLVNLNRPADLQTIYTEVAAVFPEKLRKNSHYEAKVRQTLQLHFKRIARGVYSN